MANRFSGEYRPSHNGASPFQYSQQAYINTVNNAPRITPDGHSTYKQSPPNTKGGYISKFTENPYKDEGGSSVKRMPKSPSKSPSGGIALPIPQKVK
jgi:hypothetical protein